MTAKNYTIAGLGVAYVAGFTVSHIDSRGIVFCLVFVAVAFAFRGGKK